MNGRKEWNECTRRSPRESGVTAVGDKMFPGYLGRLSTYFLGFAEVLFERGLQGIPMDIVEI
jgi:hypothetical protein